MNSDTSPSPSPSTSASASTSTSTSTSISISMSVSTLTSTSTSMRSHFDARLRPGSAVMMEKIRVSIPQGVARIHGVGDNYVKGGLDVQAIIDHFVAHTVRKRVTSIEINLPGVWWAPSTSGMQHQASTHALRLLDELLRPASRGVRPLVGRMDLSRNDLDDHFLVQFVDFLRLPATRVDLLGVAQNKHHHRHHHHPHYPYHHQKQQHYHHHRRHHHRHHQCRVHRRRRCRRCVLQTVTGSALRQ